MRRIITILAFVASVLITDLHWCVLQSVTWAHMIHESSAPTLSEKIATVISGKNPCDHCHAIETERHSSGEKTLELITKSILLSPIEAKKVMAGRHDSVLFALSPEFSAATIRYGEGIDHPPRA